MVVSEQTESVPMTANRLETIWIDEETLLTAMEIAGAEFRPMDVVVENWIIGEAFRRDIANKTGRSNG